MPGEDDLTQPQVIARYAAYVAAIAALARRAAESRRSVFQALYDAGPDFAMMQGILGIALTSSALAADANDALAAIDDAVELQRDDPRLHALNEFYANIPPEGARGGLGWHTEFDTEDDRQEDPDIVGRPAKRRREEPEKEKEREEDERYENERLTGSIQDALTAAHVGTWGGSSHGGNQSGKFHTDTVLRGQKSYDDHPGTLILLRLSRALYDYVQARCKVTEVQSLCVAGRIVVCANESIAEQFIHGFATDKKTLKAVVKSIIGDPDTYRYRAPASAGKESGAVLTFSHDLSVAALQGAFAPEEAASIIAAAAVTDEADVVKCVVAALRSKRKWVAGSYEEAAAWLRTAGSEGGVFWMDPPKIGACHAEGALAAVLVLSGITAPALITGTMRPCTGCYLTLRYVRERLGVVLRGAPTHNGGFWASTQTGGMLALIDAFIAGQLQNLPLYKDADDETRESIRQAFREEGVEAFCRFVKRNFPESSNASNLLSEDTVPQPGQVPNAGFRRTITMPSDEWQQYQEEKAAEEARLRRLAEEKAKEEEEEGEGIGEEEEEGEDAYEGQGEEEEEDEYEGEGEGLDEEDKGEGEGLEEEEEAPQGRPESSRSVSGKRKRETGGP